MKRLKELKYLKNYIGIFLSLFILDFGLRFILSKEISYYNITSLSPNLFTISWIFIIIGILYFMKLKMKKIIYIIINSSMLILTYIKYLALKTDNSFNFDLLNYTDYKIVLLITISLIIFLITIYFMNKEIETEKSKLDKLIILLLMLIIIGGCRGTAIMSLGPEKISDNKKIEKAPKNIYLYGNDNKKIKVAGLYEYLYSDLKEFIINQYDYNKEKINERY